MKKYPLPDPKLKVQRKIQGALWESIGALTCGGHWEQSLPTTLVNLIHWESVLSEIPKSRHQLIFQCIPFCFLLSQLLIFSGFSETRTPKLTLWASGHWVSCARVELSSQTFPYTNACEHSSSDHTLAAKTKGCSHCWPWCLRTPSEEPPPALSTGKSGRS